MKIICIILFIFLNIPLFADVVDTHQAFQQGLEGIKHYKTQQGNDLRYTFFESPVVSKKGTIFFLQGRGTFLEFYEPFVAPLLERGFDVWTFDLTGQGGSSRILREDKHHDDQKVKYLQHIECFDIYLLDIHSFLSEIVLPETQGKIMLAGYSTGGHLALRYLQKYVDHPFEAVFVISPLLAIKTSLPHSVFSYLFWGASWVVNFEQYVPGANHEDPIYHMSFLNNPYTGDELSYLEMTRLCRQYPLLMMGGASLGWVDAALRSIKELWNQKAMDRISIPVLIATGGEDGVVDVSYNEGFANRLKNSTHIYYPLGRHELFRETKEIREKLWEEFDQFAASQFMLPLLR